MASGSGNFVLDKGFNASAAITKFEAVKLTAAETASPIAADTDVVAGFEQFGVTAGEITKGKGASVRMAGITQAVAVGTCTVGALLTVTAAGGVQDATVGDRIVGICTRAAATGGYASLLFTPGLGIHA